jgi:hypothetical protein
MHKVMILWVCLALGAEHEMISKSWVISLFPECATLIGCGSPGSDFRGIGVASLGGASTAFSASGGRSTSTSLLDVPSQGSGVENCHIGSSVFKYVPRR